MVTKRRVSLCARALAICFLAFLWSPLHPGPFVAFSQGEPPRSGFDAEIIDYASRSFIDGRRIFRFDTFGSEDFWGGMLRLHQALAGTANGGIAEGVSPRMALAVGLKVDTEALPASLIQALRGGMVNLEDPAVTLDLLRLNAVVGLTGFFDGVEGNSRGGRINSLGIQCALCHSTVDDSFAPGIGRRLDGWPNRDLNVGAIVALAPMLKPFEDLLGIPEPAIRRVLNSWGPGKFDAELVLDGKAFGPGGKSAATLLPPVFAWPV
jgi:hypothetical protein